jgi:hypothetical protein
VAYACFQRIIACIFAAKFKACDKLPKKLAFLELLGLRGAGSMRWIYAYITLAICCFWAPSAFAEKRVALVIGNAAYAGASLANPANDADDVAAALNRLEFDVVRKKDLTVRGFDEALDAFESAAKGADVALFFFSGHGVQIDKRGYLAPIDVKAETESSALRELVAIQEIVSRIEHTAKASVILLDACRDSPLQERLRRIAIEKNREFVPAKGLPPISVTGSNTLIVYATAPGETASDGKGRNSPFTASLLKNIDTPGLEIEQMFKQVTADVLRATGGKQQPERLSRMQSILVLAPAKKDVGAQAPMPAHGLEDLEVDQNGTCDPKIFAGAGIKLGRPEGYTFALQPGRILTATAEAISRPVEREVKVFDRVEIYGESQKSGKFFVAAGEGEKGKICGWAATSNSGKDSLTKVLLMRDEQFEGNIGEVGRRLAFSLGPKPVPVSKGPGAGSDPDNPLWLKAIITSLNVSRGESAPIYDNLDSIRPSQRAIDFNIYEIYDWVNLPSKKAPAPGRDGNYYLIGEPHNGAVNLLGWIQDIDVYLWKSRIAVYWRTDESGAYASDASQMKIYEEPETLKADGAPLLLGPKPGHKVEASDGVLRRYPVIEMFPNEEEIQEEINKEKFDHNADRSKIERLIKYLKISVPGEVCNKDKSDCMENLQETITQKFRNIDVLFVLEGSASMEPYFQSIVSAMSRFVEKFKSPSFRHSVQFGVYTYGDYKGRGTGRIEGKLDIPLMDSDSDQLSKLRNLADNFGEYGLPYQQDGLPKAPFKALINATRLVWRPDAGVRLIIHIGAYGNRDYGMTGTTSPPKETVKVEDVIAALKEEHIGYIPIAVLGDTGGDARVTRERKFYRAKFREQARTIARGAGPALPLAITYEDDREQETTGAPAGDIHTALERSVQISASGLKELESIEICGEDLSSQACLRALGEPSREEQPIIQFASQIINKSDLQALAIYKRRQTAAEGYIKPFDDLGRPALTYWVAMDEQVINDFGKAARTLCNAFSSGKNERGSAAISLQDKIYLTLGVRRGYASPAALLAERSFIPNFYLSPILSRPWHDIELILRSDEAKDRETVKKWSERFCEKSYLLELVNEGKKAFSKPKRQPSGLFKSDDERPFSWVSSGDQGLELYYVPLDYLP